ncbi:transporter substrate-binding domain-containing protein [Croceicoccus naphthovorans]|uniref:ABC transporter substrate-binding protein n=1 Tax=Croceicoccus naphthovorans TaxID=1348774 RepID=A0A0G3XG24_9SPHN|nr:transporter substrate-binding domain-containing protein [Croceicoccus naphthovorans]AKM09544.1 ABC transporter substrate-binding protein [Croceicoccus naphthovorans]MBB3989700.1 ABC-type amino acid transport substrate-binding protein [Croceicoccus naphthovorans]
MNRVQLTLAALMALLAAIVAPQLAHAQPTPTPDEMRIATREAPPFAIKGDDGHWEGLAIDLWRAVAEANEYQYRFVETDLPGMIDGVAGGEFDASVGALTITRERERELDFSHPFFTTGYGIAVRKDAPGWLSLLGQFFTWGFLKTILVLIAMLGVVGALFWLAERKRNPDEFPADATGVGSGFWFAAVTMTTVGYGDKAPRTPAGKLVALVWMFTALLIISTITGMIASSLTTGRLEGQVSGPADLDGVQVGVIADSAGAEWLARDGISARSFAEVSEGLVALADGSIDAFVHDDPILRYDVAHGRATDDLRVLPGSFGRQDYGIALPADDPRREDVNLALLRHIESDSWTRDVTEQLGGAD